MRRLAISNMNNINPFSRRPDELPENSKFFLLTEDLSPVLHRRTKMPITIAKFTLKCAKRCLSAPQPEFQFSVIDLDHCTCVYTKDSTNRINRIKSGPKMTNRTNLKYTQLGSYGSTQCYQAYTLSCGPIYRRVTTYKSTHAFPFLC